MHLAYCLTCSFVAVAALGRNPGEAQGLKLTVTAAKHDHILYEPVVFRIALEYVGEKPLVVVPAWDRQWGGLQVWLAATPRSEDERPPPAAEYRGSPYSLSPPGLGQPRGPLRLYREQALTHVEAALWYRRYFAEVPGVLWIKARYRYREDPDKYLESPPVAVRFDQVPERERQVTKLWATPEVASVVQYGTALEKAEREKARRDLETIVTEYHDSVYSFYAQLALSKPAKWADVAFEGLSSLAPGAEPNLALVQRAERLVAERERHRRMLFPDDNRLDALVRYDLVELTPLEELLEVAGKQTKVPLQVGEPLEQKSWIISGRSAADDAALGELLAQLGPDERIFIFRPLKGTAPLREVMKRFLSAGRTWVPHEGGYLLTTTEHARTLQRPQGEDARDSTPPPHRTPRADPESADAPSVSTTAVTTTTSGLDPQAMLLGVLGLCTVLLATALAYTFATRH